MDRRHGTASPVGPGQTATVSRNGLLVEEPTWVQIEGPMRARSSKLSGVRPSNASASAMQAVPGDGQVLAHGPGPNGHASRADEAGGEVVIAETIKNEIGDGKLSKNCTSASNFSPNY